ncbi:hypothetical protein FRB99_000465 [Tulasnella sp. 403]|nr:hypothetical protein FRB99_000465 [Tulasnella sp. 403]
MKRSFDAVLTLALLFLASQPSNAQNAVVTTSFSQSIGIGTSGTIRQLVTASVPIPITVSGAAPVTTPAGGSNQPAATGSGSVPVSGSGAGTITGGVLVSTTSSGARPVTTLTGPLVYTYNSSSATTTSSLPAAPQTTVPGTYVAPYPGQTQDGIIMGPDDSYIAAATRVPPEIGLAIVATVFALCFGAVQVL